MLNIEEYPFAARKRGNVSYTGKNSNIFSKIETVSFFLDIFSTYLPIYRPDVIVITVCNIN